jgi:hypothetical protein
MIWTQIKSQSDYPPEGKQVLVKYKKFGPFDERNVFDALEFNHDDEHNDFIAYTSENMISINQIEKWTEIIE